MHQLLPILLAFHLEHGRHQVLERIDDTEMKIKFIIPNDLAKVKHSCHIPFRFHREVKEQPFLCQRQAPPDIDNVISYELDIHEHFDGYALWKQNENRKKLFSMFSLKEENSLT